MTPKSTARQMPISPPAHLAHIKFPNFFLIGVQKGSTTSLYHYLNQHPDVYMGRRKGAHFFLSEKGKLEPFAGQDNNYWKNVCRTWDEYAKAYDTAKDQRIIGDASVWYQYRTNAAKRIYRYRPDAKIVSVLRDPVERAFSQFRNHVQIGLEKVFDFGKAIKEDERHTITNQGIAGHYLQQGFYYQQLSEWFKYFPDDQIRVYLIEDLAENASKLLQELYEFLGVDPSFVPDVSVRFNVGQIPPNRGPVRSEFLRFLSLGGNFDKEGAAKLPHWKKKLLQWNSLPLRLDREVRSQLIEHYREDINQLQDLLDRDLSAWLEV